jgi:DNA-binding GntR family transcriptional regulator
VIASPLDTPAAGRAMIAKAPDDTGAVSRARVATMAEAAVRFAPVQSQSLSDRVYRQLRDHLMRGILKPDQRLRLREVAVALGTSETPVREAVFQLVRDGALELKPHHYIRVRRLTVAQYLEIRDIRLLLEPLAAERALDNLDAAAIEELTEAHQRLISAEAAKDPEAAIRANFEFHFGLYWRSGMPELIELLESLWMRVGPMLNLLYPHGHPHYDVRHQHENVLDALRLRDRGGLTKAIRDDMLEGGRNFLRHLEKMEVEGWPEA